MSTETRTAHDALVADLAAAAAAYYDSAALRMSDAEYDAGLAVVEAALGAHPDWASPASDALLGQVAAGQSAGGDVTHPTRMLSMAKATDLADVDALVERVQAIGRDGLVVEPKMDGLALRVEYVRGRLVLAATRGDGSTGEDVTAQVLRGDGVAGLPAVLADPWTGEVRGEVYMTVSDFEAAQVLRAERGGKPFVNPRNAVAGALRKSGGESQWMPLSFAAYDLTTADEAIASLHTHRMSLAATLGFTTAQHLMRQAGVNPGPFDYPQTVRLAIAEIETARPHLPFEIDGAVVKADADRARAALGEGSRTPNWALAYKYAAEEASSTIEDIEVTVGRTGRIGLRARIAPTFVGGTTVTYATLHNPAFVAEQGLGIGSKVVLKRAGDVIPRVTAALDGNDAVAPWTPPVACPQCAQPWNTDSLLWRCETPDCSVAARITYWASRDALDVEGLGGTVAEALAETVFGGGRQVKDVADLYDLTTSDWASLVLGTTPTGGTRTLGEANARKIMLSLLDSKKQPFHRVLTGLGIRGTGRSLSRALAREFPTMAALRAAAVEDLGEVEKIGPKKALLIAEQVVALGPVIDRLAAHGLNMGAEPDPAAAADLPLAGKTIVISGSVPGYTRTTVQEKIEALGGKASSSVSKTTSFLVTAETTTSKAKKAADLGIQVVDPDEFAALLNGEAV